MIHRITRGQIPKKPHTVFEVDGKLTYCLLYTSDAADERVRV